MDSILTLTPYGEDIPGPAIRIETAIEVLERLEKRLEAESLRWSDVALLLIANSKTVADRHVQHDSDQALLAGLNTFCAERDWFPSLVGASVKSGFFAGAEDRNLEINEGLLLVAFSSAVFDKLPVGFEITAHANDRRLAGRRALERAVQRYRSKIEDYRGVSRSSTEVGETSIGLVFTSGSGHIEETDVDFKECYAVGQELLAAAKTAGAQLFGGCATNKTPGQRQCLYYSEEVRDRVHYQCTYSHGAIVVFLPYQRAIAHVEHPYKRANVGKLDLEFHEREQYAEGRYFYVRRINGRPPVEFLADYWMYSVEDLERMAREHTAIPNLPQAHLVTIASGANRYDDAIWPNVPIWLDEEEGDDGETEILLRLVRAETDDSNYYLMELDESDLSRNAEELVGSVRANYNEDTAVLAFLCESRKYLLDYFDTNAEAEIMVNAAPREGALVGIYLNGEYSTGFPRSIGYHNYSQIAAIMGRRRLEDLPHDLVVSRSASTAELFVCHATVDKPTAEAIVNGISRRIPGIVHWRDDANLGIGDELTAEIDGAIGTDDQFFLVFLSESSLASPWVRRELKIALAKERDLQRSGRLKRKLILPIVLDPKGDAVTGSLREFLGKDMAKAIEGKAQVRIHEFTASELDAKAAVIAEDIRNALSSERSDGRSGPGGPMAALPPKLPKKGKKPKKRK